VPLHILHNESNLVLIKRIVFSIRDTGELDPDRMGSGIQYGDPSLRRSIRPGRARGEAKNKCAAACSK
jgi:Ras-related protein Rab-4B